MTPCLLPDKFLSLANVLQSGEVRHYDRSQRILGDIAKKLPTLQSTLEMAQELKAKRPTTNQSWSSVGSTTMAQDNNRNQQQQGQGRNQQGQGRNQDQGDTRQGRGSQDGDSQRQNQGGSTNRGSQSDQWDDNEDREQDENSAGPNSNDSNRRNR